MSKIEDAAERLAKTKRTKEAQDQCLYDFEVGAKWMLKQICEWMHPRVSFVEYLDGISDEPRNLWVSEFIKEIKTEFQEEV